MKIDVIFDFAKVYDISRMDVVKGESFQLISDGAIDNKWFADNDEVLTMKVTGAGATVKASAAGTSTVLIMNGSKEVVKELTISVVDKIDPLAAKLNLTAA